MVSLCSEPESVEEMANRSKDSSKEEVNQLKNRIRDLDKALTYYDFVICVISNHKSHNHIKDFSLLLL